VTHRVHAWESEDLSWLSDEAQRLIRFACTRMVHSYKPVLVGIFLDRLPRLSMPMSAVADSFLAFYRDRWQAGGTVERRGCAFVERGMIDDHACRITAGKVVRQVVADANGWATVSGGEVRFTPPSAWCELGEPAARSVARTALSRALAEFYERIELQGEAVYGRTKRHAAASARSVVSFLSDPDDSDDLFIL